MNRPQRLTQAYVRSVSKPGRYGDGGRGSNGLSLLVRSAASKSYAQRLRTADGKVLTVGLGSAESVTLQEVREAALDNIRKARKGEPIREAAPAPVRVAPTLRDLAERYLDLNRSEWRNPRTEKQRRNRLEQHAKPLLDMPVDRIERPDVLETLIPIRGMTETPYAVRDYIRDIMTLAIGLGLRTTNPCDDALDKALFKGQKRRRNKHHAATPYREVAQALDAIAQKARWPVNTLALRFLALTATRSGETRGATWQEIDMDARVWTIPGSRMKTGREHRVPLSSAAIHVLGQAAEYADASGLVFPSRRGRRIAENVLSGLFRACELSGTPHGLRSAFRDWAAESGVAHDLAEACLAHATGNATVQAYRRTDFFVQRIPVIARWAQVVEGNEPQAEVVQFPAAANT